MSPGRRASRFSGSLIDKDPSSKRPGQCLQEQQDASGDAEGGHRDVEKRQQELAGHRDEQEDEGGDRDRARGQLEPVGLMHLGGQRREPVAVGTEESASGWSVG